jgi:hypothetical protein
MNQLFVNARADHHNSTCTELITCMVKCDAKKSENVLRLPNRKQCARLALGCSSPTSCCFRAGK